MYIAGKPTISHNLCWIIDMEVLPKVLEQWKASLVTGQMFDVDFSLRGADGIFHLFLTRVLSLKDAAGNIFQWFGTCSNCSFRI